MKNNLALILACFVLPLSLSAQTGGTLDPSFNNTGIVNMRIDGQRTSFCRVRVQPDGKILAAGYVFNSIGFPGAVLLRLNPDGSLDTDFANNGIFNTLEIAPPNYFLAYDCHLLPDGKILIVADVAWQNRIATIRLLPNGQLDSSYGQAGFNILNYNLASPVAIRSVLLPNGKLVLSGVHLVYNPARYQGFAARLMPDGTFDASFGQQGLVAITTGIPEELWFNGVAVQPDGKIVLPGIFGTDSTDYKWHIYRLEEDGDLDPTFGTNGLVAQNLGTQYYEGAYEATVLSNGKILVAGTARKLPGYHFTLLRLLPNGTLDNSFGLGGKAQLSVSQCCSVIYDVVELSDGRIMACGLSDIDTDHYYFAVARLKPNGLADPTFGDGGKIQLEFAKDSSQRAQAMAIQPDGKILVAGMVESLGNSVAGILVRLNPSAQVSTFFPSLNPVLELQTAPNPFANLIRVNYTLELASKVSIDIFDLLGRQIVKPLNDAPRTAGEQQEDLPLPDDLPTGQYILRLETGFGCQSIKIVKT